MNKNIRIKVKTPVGLTESADTGPGATQGSVDAAIISSVSIGNDVSDTFASSDGDYEVTYENIHLSPLIFMDDIFRMAESVESAQYANNLMELIIGRKGLQFNEDKCMFVLMGNKRERKILKEQLNKTPLKLCNQNMKEVKVLKYLGENISFNLEDSVHQTVLKRVATAKHVILEIRTVVEDTRSELMGSLNVAFSIWETAVLPMLLFNCESWVSIGKKTIKVLDDFFHSFCKTILRVSSGCPIPSFYWQSGSTKISNIILQRKMNFVHHLANLPETALGRIIIDEQIKKSLPGLYKEVEEHLVILGISDLRSINKWRFKNLVKKFIRRRNEAELLESIRGYKKLNYEELSQETFGRKSYFFSLPLDAARMRFRIASKLVQTIRTNFSSQYRRKGQLLTCPLCSKSDLNENASPATRDMSDEQQSPQPLHSQSHILTECEAMSDLRTECEPNDDYSLAIFFKKVVARNMELENLDI